MQRLTVILTDILYTLHCDWWPFFTRTRKVHGEQIFYPSIFWGHWDSSLSKKAWASFAIATASSSFWVTPRCFSSWTWLKRELKLFYNVVKLHSSFTQVSCINDIYRAYTSVTVTTPIFDSMNALLHSKYQKYQSWDAAYCTVCFNNVSMLSLNTCSVSNQANSLKKWDHIYFSTVRLGLNKQYTGPNTLFSHPILTRAKSFIQTYTNRFFLSNWIILQRSCKSWVQSANRVLCAPQTPSGGRSVLHWRNSTENMIGGVAGTPVPQLQCQRRVSRPESASLLVVRCNSYSYLYSSILFSFITVIDIFQQTENHFWSKYYTQW